MSLDKFRTVELFELLKLAGEITPRSDLSYSSVMRKLRKNHKDKVTEFQEMFKKTFDEGMEERVDDVEDLALLAGLQLIDVELD